MSSESYQDWISIFDDELKSTWEKEKAPFRKLAMIHSAFHNELDSLKHSLNREFSEIKTAIRKKMFLNKCQKFAGLAQSEKFDDSILDKENKNYVALREHDCNDIRKEDCFIESPNTSEFFQNRTPSSNPVKSVSGVSPILRKNSFTKTKMKRSNSPKNKTAVVAQKDQIENVEDSKDFRTPKNYNDSNIMECSVIEDTPDLKAAKRMKSKKSKVRPRLNQSKQANTLTQMFFEPQKTKKEIDSEMASMSITKMIDLINDSSGSDTDATVDLEATADAVPDNLKSFVENYDKIPEKKDDNPKFVFQEVVRGNARKKLKGWSCGECKDYYEALNLPPDELEKKKNECSKHRHRFKPREETFSGFWDLTFGPSPKTQDSEASLVFNYKKT